MHYLALEYQKCKRETKQSICSYLTVWYFTDKITKTQFLITNRSINKPLLMKL